MCSLFAAIQFERPFQEETIAAIKKSNDLTGYRGPDTSSYQLFTTEKVSVFLGHRRLSIIDLSPEGNQPMESNGIWIVFNGEIFNYLEIREELVRQGCVFKSKSDTEVILKVYETYGAKGFSKFNGMWSFALYDSHKKIILVSRDRFSIKPLYYYQDKDFIAFASEIKQLLPFVQAKKINAAILKTFLLQGVQDFSNDTFFKNITKVPPASTLTLNLVNKEISIAPYWSFSFDQETSSEADAIEKLQHLLKRSIQLRLRSDVPIGCLLSGGLDSSVIADYANQLNPNPIQTFSIVSDNKKESEETFIDVMIRERNINNRKLSFDPTTAIDCIDPCLYHQDEPFPVASVVAQFMIYELIKKETGIKVVLSGQGGDEILMGYLKYFFFNIQDLLRKKKYFRAGLEVFYSLIHRTAILQFDAGRAKRYIPSRLTDKINFVNNVGPLENIWEVDTLRNRQVADIERYSVPALTHYEDRNSMAHSIESRAPFLDHELVNFLVNLPTSFKYKNGWSKYMLRQSATNLPDSIRWRRDKKSFSLPEKEWLVKELRPEIHNLAKSSILAEMNFIDQKKLEHYLVQFYKNRSDTDSKEIFSLLIAERWARCHFG